MLDIELLSVLSNAIEQILLLIVIFAPLVVTLID